MLVKRWNYISNVFLSSSLLGANLAMVAILPKLVGWYWSDRIMFVFFRNISNFYLRKILVAIRVLRYKKKLTYCHVCKKSTFSVLVGFPPNLLTACGDCLSLSRQRLVARYLASINIDQLKGLHFAPEPGLANMFRSTKGSRYEPVDMRVESYQKRSRDWHWKYR